MFKYVFGPVPSRRLGMSLGINNIPYKICSYACIYCQLGKTLRLSIDRKPFSEPQKIVSEIRKIVESGAKIDYITFVPDGEPTLDTNLGASAREIKSNFDYPLAILTNSSLIWDPNVVSDLKNFDLVSLKMDSTVESIWKTINRPNEKLSLVSILDGIKAFSRAFHGEIITETMLASDVNTSKESLEATAKFISSINIDKAYIAIPIRPPTEKWVRKPREEELLLAYRVFTKHLGEEKVELLNMPEPQKFEATTNAEEYILDVIRVHPLRIEYALEILSKDFDDPNKKIVEMANKKLIKIVEFEGEKYIVRYYMN